MKKNGPPLIVAFFAAIFIAHSAVAAEPKFSRISIGNGASVEVPEHWVQLDRGSINDAALAAELGSASRGGDNDVSKDRKIVLLSSAQHPLAQIRISFLKPEQYSQADLSNATDAILKGTTDDLTEELRASLSASGITLKSTNTAKIEDLGGKKALSFSYVRSAVNEQSLWAVEQINVPLGEAQLMISLSYQEGRAIVYRPILQHVKKSLMLFRASK